MTLDERDLIAGLRAGDPQGFQLLYERYADRVTGFVSQLTGNRSETEDIVQEVFLAAYTGRATFQQRSRLLTWLLAIASRRWRDRQRQRRVPTISLTEDDSLGESAASLASCHSLEADVITSVTLSRALAQLEPPFREALLLVASQGRTYREAAEILEEPVGTVKWRVSVATRRLAGILHAIEEEGDAMHRGSGADCRSGGR